MGKSRRAKAAARAAKRIPIVGATVALLPVFEAGSEAFGSNLSNIANMQAWANFLNRLKGRYTGVNDSGQIDGVAIAKTWTPIIAYIVARKTGLSKPVSRALGRFGLKF